MHRECDYHSISSAVQAGRLVTHVLERPAISKELPGMRAQDEVPRYAWRSIPGLILRRNPPV